MRFFVVSVLVLSGCGGRELPADPPGPATSPDEPPLVVPAEPAGPVAQPRSGRVRLTASIDENLHEGVRLRDRAIIAARLVGASWEHRTMDGRLVTGSEMPDLEIESARFYGLRALPDALCVTEGPVASLAAVDPTGCVTWTSWAQLGLVFASTGAGTGLLLRTPRDGAFRVWVVDSGWDAATRRHFAVIDYRADP
jgi:hypothetical protein